MSEGRVPLGDYLTGHDAVQSLLAIDLGNSRTGVVVVDHVNERSYDAETHADIPLDGRDAFKDAQSGPFESLVACIVDDPSFVRIGKHARQINYQLKGETGEKSLSSPKRYFFDMEPSRTGWLAGMPKFEKNAFESVALSGELAEALARRYGCDEAKRLPRVGLLGGMVVELYTQAMRFVNSVAFQDVTGDGRPRFISHVHVTYPTTLTDDEKARYVLQIDKALRVHTALNGDADAPFIEVRSDADEAAAVLGHFAEREIRRADGNVLAWLASIGRATDAGSYSARVAVIDIGGGTTDLTIADILAQGAGKATVLQLFLDGVNRAGDDVIAELVNSVLFDQVAKAVIGSAGGVTRARFKQEYNAFVEGNASIIRVLASVAVKALLLIEAGGGNVDIRLAETTEDRADFVKLRKRIIDGDPEEGWADGLKIVLTAQDRATLRERMESVLLPVLEEMGREIAAFECDALVVSGKVTSVKAVHDLLARCVPLPPWAVVNMNNLAGGGEDVKYATVRGGALAALHAMGVTNAPCHIEFAEGGDLASGYDWGYTSSPHIQNLQISVAMGTALPQTPDGRVSFPYANRTVYLLRQRTGGWGTVAVSHEITKCDPHTPVVGNVFVTLSVKDGRVFICEVTGGYSVDDFECRVHGFTGGRHWMDHGQIE